MATIKQVLMKRDGLTSVEADILIQECKDALADYLANGELDLAEEVCDEYFGLEPDFLTELL